MGEVGSAVLISVGKEHREWQNAVKCRKTMSKGNACDVESSCAGRRTQVITSLLPMLKGASSLSNEAVDFGNRISACREEGSIACDTLKVQGAASLGVGQGRAGGNVFDCETGLCCASVGQGTKMRDMSRGRVRDARSRGAVPGSRGHQVRGEGSVSVHRSRRGRSS